MSVLRIQIATKTQECFLIHLVLVWASITKISDWLVQIPKIYFLVLSGLDAKVKVPTNMFLKALLAGLSSHCGKKMGK